MAWSLLSCCAARPSFGDVIHSRDAVRPARVPARPGSSSATAAAAASFCKRGRLRGKAGGPLGRTRPEGEENGGATVDAADGRSRERKGADKKSLPAASRRRRWRPDGVTAEYVAGYNARARVFTYITIVIVVRFPGFWRKYSCCSRRPKNTNN